MNFEFRKGEMCSRVLALPTKVMETLISGSGQEVGAARLHSGR